jgi:hypothetical protein
MHCTLHHADGVVTDIDARTLRIPTTACPGATLVLRELVGLPLATPQRALYDTSRVRQHCTHLFDIAALAIAHAARPVGTERVYDAAVPDEVDHPVAVTVACNGELIHCWLVREHRIVEPTRFAGNPVLGGFARWANAAFEGDALEAAMVLARTCFIATGAAYLTETWTGLPLRLNEGMAGVCHAYAPETLGSSWFIGGGRRDFTNGVVEQLEQFSTSDAGTGLD